MKDEIKEILDFDFESQGERIEINEYERDILKDCITNLQKELEEERRIEQASLNTITNLQEEVEDLRRIFGVWNNRKLIKKFNKEYDKEDKNKNPNRDYVAIYPDAEEVYKRYYDLKEENKRLNNIILQTKSSLKDRIKSVPETMAEVYEDEFILNQLNEFEEGKSK